MNAYWTDEALRPVWVPELEAYVNVPEGMSVRAWERAALRDKRMDPASKLLVRQVASRLREAGKR